MTISTSQNLTIFGIGSILAALGAAAVQFAQGGFNAVSWGALLAAIVAGVTAILAKGASTTNAPLPGPSQTVTVTPGVPGAPTITAKPS